MIDYQHRQQAEDCNGQRDHDGMHTRSLGVISGHRKYLA
jgi:hypothetical protein